MYGDSDSDREERRRQAQEMREAAEAAKLARESRLARERKSEAGLTRVHKELGVARETGLDDRSGPTRPSRFGCPQPKIADDGGSDVETDPRQTAERIQPWIDLDGWTEDGNALQDIWRNYQDMKKANTIGGDKYYHCKANCEATARGLAGETLAQAISAGREIVDVFKNRYCGLSGTETARDLVEDMSANIEGQIAGRTIQGSTRRVGTRCAQACSSLKPKGIE